MLTHLDASIKRRKRAFALVGSLVVGLLLVAVGGALWLTRGRPSADSNLQRVQDFLASTEDTVISDSVSVREVLDFMAKAGVPLRDTAGIKVVVMDPNLLKSLDKGERVALLRRGDSLFVRKQNLKQRR